MRQEMGTGQVKGADCRIPSGERGASAGGKWVETGKVGWEKKQPGGVDENSAQILPIFLLKDCRIWQSGWTG